MTLPIQHFDVPVPRPNSRRLIDAITWVNSPNERWTHAGISWDSLPVNNAGITMTIREDGTCTTTGLPKTFHQHPGIETGLTFTINAAAEGPANCDPDELSSRAEQNLLFNEALMVESIIWPMITGSLPIVNSLPVSPTYGVGLINQFVGQEYNTAALIHAPQVAVPHIGKLDVNDSRIVSGFGYFQPNFADNTAVIYGTGRFVGARSNIFYGSDKVVYDVQNNNAFAVAERTYSIGLDTENITDAAGIGVRIDLTGCNSCGDEKTELDNTVDWPGA